MNPVRTLLVGAGKMGKNHLRVLQEDSRFNVVAVVDPNVIDIFAGVSTNFSQFKEIEHVSLDYDAIVCAVPSALHFKFAKKLIKLGKPFLIEKPLSIYSSECYEIIEEADENCVKFAVGHLERFNPAVLFLKRLMDDKLITPFCFEFNRFGGYPKGNIEGNNVLLDLAVHDIDIFNFLCKSVRFEHSSNNSLINGGVIEHSNLRVSTRFCQTTASINVSWLHPSRERTISAIANRMVCNVDLIKQEVKLHCDTTCPAFVNNVDKYCCIYEKDTVTFEVEKKEPLKSQLHEFFKMVNDETNTICSAEDASLAVKVAEEAANWEYASYNPCIY